MNVYIVYEIEWEDKVVRGIYSTMELAVARQCALTKASVDEGLDGYYQVVKVNMNEDI